MLLKSLGEATFVNPSLRISKTFTVFPAPSNDYLAACISQCALLTPVGAACEIKSKYFMEVK